VRGRLLAALLGGLAAKLGAQADPAEAFRNEIRAAATAAHAGRPGDLRAASGHLDAAEGLIERLTDRQQRAQARLVVLVRRADLLFRAPQPNLTKAAELVRGAREAARTASVWTGPYQETGLLLLWQAMPPVEFFDLVASAPEDLAVIEGEVGVSVDNRVPLRLVRADLRLFQRREREAVAEWTEVSTELRGGGAEVLGLSDEWWDKCHGALVWHLLEQRDYARAAVYVPLLRDRTRRTYYGAVLANQRGDFAGTEAVLAGCTDAPALLLLGDAQERLGKLADAIATYERAERSAGGDAELRAAAQNGLGDCYRRRRGEGDAERAEACYRRSLDLLAGLSSRKADSESAGNHRDLGLLAEQRGDVREAFVCHGRALDELERARAGIPLDPFGAAFIEPEFLGAADNVEYLGAVDGVLRTWRASGASPWCALAAMDRAKARSLLDRVASPRALEESPEVLVAVRRLALARDQASVQEARLALEAARASVEERTRLARPSPLDERELQRLLAAEPDTAVLAYWVGAEAVWLVAARGCETRVFDLGGSADGSAHLRAAYGIVSRAPDGTDPWPSLDAVAGWFVPAPARSLLAGATLVVFCPDDRLARLPFEALPVDGVPLGLRFDVERAPSLAVRDRVRARAAPAVDATVVVDSVPMTATLAKDFGLDALQFSRREGDLVAEAWPGALRLQGSDATLAELRARLGSRHVGLLHVSSHAVVRGVVPSASLLLLADGAVPLSSLGEMPLEDATVVLSACGTGTGEERGGEGDAGLLWGPLGAGAGCVVASLWAVNQQATCDLMGQFHHWLARGESAASALRRARQALAAAPNYAHPHYWAGFAVFGSRSARSARWAWFAGSAALVALLGFSLWTLWRAAHHRAGAPEVAR